jgi:hypothetical protein
MDASCTLTCCAAACPSRALIVRSRLYSEHNSSCPALAPSVSAWVPWRSPWQPQPA